MKFNRINMDQWHRKDTFIQFMDNIRCVITLTGEVDVTSLVQACKETGYRFYPVYIYLVAKIVNKRPEFKMSYDKDGAVGYWDVVSPSYIVFHPEDEAVTRLVTEYTPDLKEFYRQVVQDMEDHMDQRGFHIPFSKTNTFDISCLPWISYTALDLHIYGNGAGAYLAPVITWGKYTMKNGKLCMPLTMQIHHCAADGFHISRFFSELQEETIKAAEYILYR